MMCIHFALLMNQVARYNTSNDLRFTDDFHSVTWILICSHVSFWRFFFSLPIHFSKIWEEVCKIHIQTESVSESEQNARDDYEQIPLNKLDLSRHIDYNRWFTWRALKNRIKLEYLCKMQSWLLPDEVTKTVEIPTFINVAFMKHFSHTRTYTI